MEKLRLTIDDLEVELEKGASILEAAQRVGIYIPALCYHPALPSFEKTAPSKAIYQGPKEFGATSMERYQGCRLCLVEIEGVEGLRTACSTPASNGMIVHTNTPAIQKYRRENLSAILANHPHACLVCPQREGCDLRQCIMNVPEDERCCWKFNFCELRRVAEYVGIEEGIPRYVPQGSSVVENEPLFKWHYNLCIGCMRCVRVCQNLRGVGALGYTTLNGKIVVGFLAPTAGESDCRFCGACVEVCPTGTLSDKGIKWPERKTALIPCQTACPAGIDVPRYVALIAQDKFSEAAAVIREKVPLPLVLGRVCTHPCEAACRCRELNEPISIAALKRFAAEHDLGLWKANLKIAPCSGRKVAIVGAGPAGLTAAYYLVRLGHLPTIFEALPYAGGMMMSGIPAYRLPRGILHGEIAEIENLGVEIRVNTYVQSLEELFEQGYEAVFVATGAHESIRMGIKGEDTPGVLQGLDFLREVNLGKKVELKGTVAVIGGGNAAIDAARVASRIGAKEVHILYRRTRAEMPATTEEIEGAFREGVKACFLSAPIRIEASNGRLKVDCILMKLGEPDESGRARPVPIEGSTFPTEYDCVIVAIGQKPKIPDNWGLKIREGTIAVDPETLTTSRQGVFAGGDAVLGSASVVEAVAMGRKAASSIDKYFGGEGIIAEKLVELEKMNPWLGPDKGFTGRRRVGMPSLPIGERLRGFGEVELGFGDKQAVEEAKRCLRCALRLQISPPILPPEEWSEFKIDNLATVPQAGGAYQLLDAEKNIIFIKGTMNLQQELEEQLCTFTKAKYFVYKEEPMYTKVESELLRQFLQRHGKLPQGNLGLDEEELY